MDNLNKEHGIDLVKVPFKGGGDAINGVLSGVTPITFLGIGNMLAHLDAGKITALLTDGDKRAALLPGVPALKETGYKGPVTRSYFALYAPTGVPKAMLEKIATDVRSVAGETDFRERNLVQRGSSRCSTRSTSSRPSSCGTGRRPNAWSISRGLRRSRGPVSRQA